MHWERFFGASYISELVTVVRPEALHLAHLPPAAQKNADQNHYWLGLPDPREAVQGFHFIFWVAGVLAAWATVTDGSD